MLKRLLPDAIDNTYPGRTIALWLLGVVTAVKVAQIVSVMLDGPGVVFAADGVPLDTFSPRAAQTVVAVFVGMGISRLFICIICALTLVRYRSSVPLIFTLLAAHDIARELVLLPIRSGTPIGVYVNGGLLAMTMVGVALSLWGKPAPTAPAGGRVPNPK